MAQEPESSAPAEPFETGDFTHKIRFTKSYNRQLMMRSDMSDHPEFQRLSLHDLGFVWHLLHIVYEVADCPDDFFAALHIAQGWQKEYADLPEADEPERDADDHGPSK